MLSLTEMEILLNHILRFLEVHGDKVRLQGLRKTAIEKFNNAATSERRELFEHYVNWIRQLSDEGTKLFIRKLKDEGGIDFYKIAYLENKEFKKIIARQSILSQKELLLPSFYLMNVPLDQQDEKLSNELKQMIDAYNAKQTAKRIKSLTDEKKKELGDLHKVIVYIFDFMIKIRQNDKMALAMIDAMRQAEQETHNSFNLRGLRSIKSDLNEMMRGASQAELAEFTGNMSPEIAELYGQFNRKRSKAISTILKRNKNS